MALAERRYGRAYIQLGELVEDALQALVKVLLSKLDLAHVEVTDTTDSKVGMDNLGTKQSKGFIIGRPVR